LKYKNGYTHTKKLHIISCYNRFLITDIKNYLFPVMGKWERYADKRVVVAVIVAVVVMMVVVAAAAAVMVVVLVVVVVVVAVAAATVAGNKG
jgi:hypothetical protein